MDFMGHVPLIGVRRLSGDERTDASANQSINNRKEQKMRPIQLRIASIIVATAIAGPAMAMQGGTFNHMGRIVPHIIESGQVTWCAVLSDNETLSYYLPQHVRWYSGGNGGYQVEGGIAGAQTPHYTFPTAGDKEIRYHYSYDQDTRTDFVYTRESGVLQCLGRVDKVLKVVKRRNEPGVQNNGAGWSDATCEEAYDLVTALYG